jgi:hypothetical protein
MGADNQAERVLNRIEFREELAELFHAVWRHHVTIAPSWDKTTEAHRSGVIAGVKAILDDIDRRIKEHDR